MASRLKRWESPRYEGRNAKGKGGSARARQIKKQHKMMRKRLKAETKRQNRGERTQRSLPFIFLEM